VSRQQAVVAINPAYPEQVIQHFVDYARTVLAGHVGSEARIWIAKAFRSLASLYVTHAVMLVRETPPKIIIDAKGRVWVFAGIEYRRKKYHGYISQAANRLVYRRVTGDEE